MKSPSRNTLTSRPSPVHRQLGNSAPWQLGTMGIHLFLIHIVFRMLYPVTVLLTRDASYYGLGKAFTHVSKRLDVVIRWSRDSNGRPIDWLASRLPPFQDTGDSFCTFTSITNSYSHCCRVRERVMPHCQQAKDNIHIPAHTYWRFWKQCLLYLLHHCIKVSLIQCILGWTRIFNHAARNWEVQISVNSETCTLNIAALNDTLQTYKIEG